MNWIQFEFFFETSKGGGFGLVPSTLCVGFINVRISLKKIKISGVAGGLKI